MEKLILNDGTEISIKNGATENTITMVLTDEVTSEDLVALMTEKNLEEYKILTEDGTECTTIKDKYVKTYTVNTEEKTVKFNLANVDMVKKRLVALEETQEMQDMAISEIADIVAEEV